jgi:hypothetical protein
MYPQDMVTPMQAELTTAHQDLHVENAIKAEEQLSSCKLSMWLCSKKCASRSEMSLDGAKKTRPFNYCFCRS